MLKFDIYFIGKLNIDFNYHSYDVLKNLAEDHDHKTSEIDMGFALANGLMLKSLNLMYAVGGKWAPIYLPNGELLPCYKALRCLGHFQQLLRLNQHYNGHPENYLLKHPLR